MNSVEKTNTLQRIDLPVDILVGQDINPNKMNNREFNLLCDNMEKVGFVDPIFVRPIEDGKYRVIGGHHRLEAGKILGYEKVPCTVIEGADYDEDWEKYQVVRMNMIKGQIDPQNFLKLYESLGEKYEKDIMAENFGFSDDKEFNKLVNQMSKSVPKEMKADFKKAAKDVKTIEGLTKLLNQMFTEHGDELPHGYMIIDFGGVDSYWITLEQKDKKTFDNIVSKLTNGGKKIDSFMRLLLQEIDKGVYNDLLDKIPTED